MDGSFGRLVCGLPGEMAEGYTIVNGLDWTGMDWNGGREGTVVQLFTTLLSLLLLCKHFRLDIRQVDESISDIDIMMFVFCCVGLGCLWDGKWIVILYVDVRCEV